MRGHASWNGHDDTDEGRRAALRRFLALPAARPMPEGLRAEVDALLAPEAKHMGPGPHPSGSPQSVHSIGRNAARLAQFGVEQGGFTYSLLTKVTPRSGFGLSLWPDREWKFPIAHLNRPAQRAVLRARIDRYKEANADLLAEPGRNIGGWVDGDDFYLDVSTVVDDAAQAERLGREHGQLAYYDFATNTGVSIAPDEGTT